MVARRRTRRRSSRKKAGAPAPGINLARIPLHAQGWYLRTLRIDSRGDYGKLRDRLELFLREAEDGLEARLWDRGLEVALEEALRHLALRWGPKFGQPLSLSIRIMDTHVKFSLTVPPSALVKQRQSLTGKQKQQRDATHERCLYVVRRLANQLHIGPAGRQLVFSLPVRREWGLGQKRRGRVR